ncbi:MAG: ABC transporter ATP-binding protein [Clostridiales bacterium]|nr:ABC transporter ATP-binding protein [Clostridiales bacterium]
MSILKLDKVGLTYFSNKGETKALDNITFSIKKNEFVSIVGPSGCGKTTILSIIAGLIKPTSGEILIEDKEIVNSNIAIGYMFQKDELFEWRTIQSNIYLGLEIKKNLTAETKAYADNLLKKYGLWDFRHKHPSELSGGMRQRVALIRTLALQPKILLLDEAFSALDYQTRLNVCDDVYRILKDEGITSILVTHDLSEAISMSDKIIVLSKRPAIVESVHNVDNDMTKTPLQRRDSIKSKELFDIIWRQLQ